MIKKFKDDIIESANIAVREIFGVSYEFELDNINFNISYDDETESYEACLIELKGRFGDNDKPDTFKNFNLTLYNIKEYDLENKQYLRGVFFGKFQAIEELV